MSSSWLASKDDIQCSVELSSERLLGQLKNPMYPDSNFASTDAFRYVLVLLRSPSDFVRIGCWNLLFKPFISSDANYRCSTSCQVPPADTKIGLILISVDYMVEVWGMHTQRNVS